MKTPAFARIVEKFGKAHDEPIPVVEFVKCDGCYYVTGSAVGLVKFIVPTACIHMFAGWPVLEVWSFDLRDVLFGLFEHGYGAMLVGRIESEAEDAAAV